MIKKNKNGYVNCKTEEIHCKSYESLHFKEFSLMHMRQELDPVRREFLCFKITGRDSSKFHAHLFSKVN